MSSHAVMFDYRCRLKGSEMRIRLRVHKGETTLYEGSYDISDASSFGAACADAWTRLRASRMAHTANIGALMERLEESSIEQLRGAEIAILPDC